MKSLPSFALLLAACGHDPDPLADVLADVQPEPLAYSIDTLVAVYCPGVVHAAGVTTYKGLAGTYRRFGLASQGELVSLVLRPDHDDPDAAGTFTGTRAPAEPIDGLFFAIGDNPAIGAALSLDLGADGAWDEVHFVLGLSRAFGRINGICLAGASRPYLMTRVAF